MGLILPGNPLFWPTLANPPRADRIQNDGDCYIVRKGSFLLERASAQELDEYLEGGEYDEHMELTGQADLLWLPTDFELI
jgi:hypothetical protein